MRAIHGAFFIEDRSGRGQDWTAEDEARLRCPRPHVMCYGLPYYVGAHAFTPGGRPCFACKASKVAQRHCDGRDFCFGCGVLQ